jgi:hypothetical protein
MYRASITSEQRHIDRGVVVDVEIVDVLAGRPGHNFRLPRVRTICPVERRDGPRHALISPTVVIPPTEMRISSF